MYQNILAEMARNGFTREKMAKLIDMSLPTFRKKLRGDIPFRMDEINLILSTLSVNEELKFEYLFKKF